MSVELKDLIKYYADEINENEFEHIYDACNSTGTRELASKLTSILYAAGIDPLVYLKTVPENFLYFNKDIKEIKDILTDYIDNYYDINDDKETWFNKMKELADKHGYCPDVKIYKENPNDYKGSIIDISMIIRVALTSKSMTPDLYEIMKLLGVKNIKERIEKIK